MRRPIYDAACSARDRAYIRKASVFVTERKQSVRTRGDDLNWAKWGVGSSRAGAFFVRNVEEAAVNKTAAVKQ